MSETTPILAVNGKCNATVPNAIAFVVRLFDVPKIPSHVGVSYHTVRKPEANPECPKPHVFRVSKTAFVAG